MARRHLEGLTAVDAAFLHQEGRHAHMHVGAVARFAGAPPAVDDLREHVRARLALVPRHRQRLATPPAYLGRPRWADDPSFNLEYHVRHAALPEPGGEPELRRLAARIFGQRLDRGKPLWELWFVEGLRDGGFALVSKTHQALVHGAGGVDLLTTMLDLTPQPRAVEDDRPWLPRPAPTPAQLAAAALGAGARTAASLPLRLAGAAATPGLAVAALREAAAGVGEVALAGLDGAPASPLNVCIGPHRRVAFVDARLDDFKLVGDALGGTVNDVLLAVVAGALRSWLRGRGLEPSARDLRAGVPVATRTPAERRAAASRPALVVVPLPVGDADPVARLRAVRDATAAVRSSRQALGAEVIAAAQALAPPLVLAQTSRVNVSSRYYNLLVTNVPGPPLPLFLLGRRLQRTHPIASLAGDRALAVAAISYDGAMSLGLLADFDALPDLDAIAVGTRRSLDELVATATGAGRRRPRRGATS